MLPSRHPAQKEPILVIKRVPERQGSAEKVPDSPWGNDWLGDNVFKKGGRQDVGIQWDWWDDLFSMGLPDPPRVNIIEPTSVVPAVVSMPPPPPALGDTPTIIGETTAPRETELRNVSWQDYVAGGGVLPADWNQYPHASDHPGVVTVEPQDVVVGTVEEDDVGILGDIYDIVDTGFGGMLPGGVPPTYSPFTPWGGPTSPASQIVSTTPGAGIVSAGPVTPTVIPGTGGPVCQPTMIFNSHTGKWTKKRRRRRRQLASRSDIRDLSALKGVLGNGKALQSWIATHS